MRNFVFETKETAYVRYEVFVDDDQTEDDARLRLMHGHYDSCRTSDQIMEEIVDVREAN